jgi:hypothetical protein
MTGLCFLIGFFSISSEICLGYILPSSQLISYMVKNFSEFQNLVINQTTWQNDDNNEEGWEAYSETIWMETPDLFRSQVPNMPLGRLMEPDTSFRSLFVADSATRVRGLLTRMGINLNAVGLTRVEETVAYRIGGKDPDAPKIVIEKKRFLPLVLTYPFPGSRGTETITVLFSDYRKIDNGWYPFEMYYFDPRGFREHYVVDTVQANVPLDSAVFTSGNMSSGSDQAMEWDEIFEEEKDSDTQADIAR